MPVLILSERVAEQVLDDYEAATGRRFDEVWDGVTYIMPEPDNEHFDLSAFFVWVFRSVFDPASGHRAGGPANVSDQPDDWRRNFRVPDISVFLAGNPAQDRGTHWFGGPDLAIEIISPGDRSRDKFDFYARIGTREVLILDRDPWQMELYQLDQGELQLRGTVTTAGGVLTSTVTPFKFQLVDAQPRPQVKITHTGTGQEWVG